MASIYIHCAQPRKPLLDHDGKVLQNFPSPATSAFFFLSIESIINTEIITHPLLLSQLFNFIVSPDLKSRQSEKGMVQAAQARYWGELNQK